MLASATESCFQHCSAPLDQHLMCMQGSSVHCLLACISQPSSKHAHQLTSGLTSLQAKWALRYMLLEAGSQPLQLCWTRISGFALESGSITSWQRMRRLHLLTSANLHAAHLLVTSMSSFWAAAADVSAFSARMVAAMRSAP